MPLTLQRETSQLVIVDVQEKLSSVMEAATLASTIKNCGILMQASQLLEIPIICTEQYPKGLGTTLSELTQYVDVSQLIAKTCFSCFDSSQFRSRLRVERPQIVLAGMEAHICVLQTALQLHESGKQVFVVEDAVISRNPVNKTNALLRLRQAGVTVSNTESVVFEWLKVAEGDAFKQISKLVR